MELPPEVIAEIEANRKIAAIKLLREHLGIDLKEAREIVDGYTRQHQSDLGPSLPRSDGGIGRLVLVIIVSAAVYGLYRFLS